MVDCINYKNNNICKLCIANQMEELRECYSKQKPLLRVYIQTILDKEPYYYRAYKVDISDHGVNFTCPDTNCNYLFDFIDVVSITPDCDPEPAKEELNNDDINNI